ncbi:hypothetical protein NZK35_01450 [Stieleria sp. ICT_E10.1]|nr:hypothetical protein [Stieleria sedimenti]
MLNRLNDDSRIAIQPIELLDERRLIFHRQPHRADGVIVAIDRRFTRDRCSIATAHDARGGTGTRWDRAEKGAQSPQGIQLV